MSGINTYILKILGGGIFYLFLKYFCNHKNISKKVQILHEIKI